MTNESKEALAPGGPGMAARWTSSAKSGVGTSLSLTSRVWFTIGYGILDEIYYPRVDQACTRDLGLIVTDGQDFFSEEKRHTKHKVIYPTPGCPAYKLVNTCEQGRYRIEKDVIADPLHDVVMMRLHFEALSGDRGDYHAYALLAPHLGNHGAGNTAWISDYKGMPMLFAERDGTALALACSVPWRKRSVGYVGASDGWQDLEQHKEMTWAYTRAENGNVALTAELDLGPADDPIIVVVGFGRNAAEAGYRARASLQEGFDEAYRAYLDEWTAWLKELSLGLDRDDGCELLRISAAMLRTHEDKRFQGGVIASLSIPWGQAKGDDDLGGYHLAWPRDLVEVAGGLLALGAKSDACRVVHYLRATQEEDGHWPQNMWLDGTPYWTGLQMDETAFPILLVDLADRHDALGADEIAELWPMVKRAAAFLVTNGPMTPQDRWEEDSGYSPFTLAAEISALLVAADMAEQQGEPDLAPYLRETADAWNAAIESWTYASDTDLAHQVGVDGYYVRIAPPQSSEGASPKEGFVAIKNRPASESTEPVVSTVSPDALALVRFGLRAADDPRIVNTTKVIDALLKVDTPAGPAWHRYNDDGYGEHEDGSPFDGTGQGRAWPLLAGERAHYELAAGHADEAERLKSAMEGFTSSGRMIPEQVWDSDDIPEKGLYFGHPSGSAMPLAWAHAEYVKLCRSLQDGQVFDTPPRSVERYQKQETSSPYGIWRFNHKSRTLDAGQTLRIELPDKARVHWSDDGWKTTHDQDSRDTGLGIHVADLPTDDLKADAAVVFTFHWSETDEWEGEDYTVKVVSEA